MRLLDLEPVTAKLYLVHPVTGTYIKDNNDEDVYWNVVGHDSDEYAQAQQDFLKFLETVGNDKKNLGNVDYKVESIAQLVALVKGWDSKFNDFHVGLDKDGDGSYSKELVKTILSSPKHKWILGQVDEFVTEREHFFPS